MQFQWKKLGVVLSLVWWLSAGVLAQTPAPTGPLALNDILALEDPPARITALQQFLKTNPNGEPALTAREALVASYAQIGETQLGENNIEKAVDAFQRAIKALPKQISDRFFEETVVKIPMAVSTRGYRAEAVALGKLLETRFNNEAARLAALGEFYLTIEASGEALHALENAARLTPEDARLHRALGAAYRMGLRIDEAIAAYQLAVRYDAKDRRAYYDLANLYRSQGAYDDALKLYQKQLEIEPKHSPSYKGLALCYTALGKDDPAAAALNQVRDLRGSSDDITQDILLQTQLAFYLLAQGKLKAARQAAEAALLIEPRFSWARIAAAEVELAEQKYFEAERHLLAAQQFANFPTLAFTLGKVYLIVEDFDGAAEHFAKAFSYTADDQFSTRLGGVREVRAEELKELLAPEHQAAIFLADPPTSDELFKIAEALTRTDSKLDRAKAAKDTRRDKVNKTNAAAADDQPEGLAQAVNAFVEAEGTRRSFRALYMAQRLAQAGQALPLAIQLAEQALELSEVATEAEGSVRDVPNYDREGRLRTFRGRALDAKGWALFKAGRNQAALSALSEAVTTYGPLPEQKLALRHLATAQETAGNLNVALELYLAAYEKPAQQTSTDVNRTSIELLYRKLHGSLNGLSEKLGQPLSAQTSELIASTVRQATAAKPEMPAAPTTETKAAETKAAETKVAANAATEPPATPDFNVNQLLVNQTAKTTAGQTSGRTNENRAATGNGTARPSLSASRNQPTAPDSGTQDPVRIGLYGIPINPNTPRISSAKPPPPIAPAKQPEERPAKVAREIPSAPTLAAPTPPPNKETVEEVAVKQAPEPAAVVPEVVEKPALKAPPLTDNQTIAVEPVPVETLPKPLGEPETKPAVVEPLRLPELGHAVPLVSALTLEPELTGVPLNLPVLEEPPRPAAAVIPGTSITVRYEEPPAKAVTETPAAEPQSPGSTRPRRVSELIPVNEPAPAARKRRVTPAPPKP
jgi:tetratricopeptide (TPR) repeat protein